jgi:hypothetical protein
MREEVRKREGYVSRSGKHKQKTNANTHSHTCAHAHKRKHTSIRTNHAHAHTTHKRAQAHTSYTHLHTRTQTIPHPPTRSPPTTLCWTRGRGARSRAHGPHILARTVTRPFHPRTSGNSLGPDGATALATPLTRLTGLQGLYLGWVAAPPIESEQNLQRLD